MIDHPHMCERSGSLGKSIKIPAKALAPRAVLQTSYILHPQGYHCIRLSLSAPKTSVIRYTHNTVPGIHCPFPLSFESKDCIIMATFES